jgi:hypothetical protein
VLEAQGVAYTAPNAETRDDLATFEGAGGDLGVSNINSHTTSFVRGLTSADAIYVLTLEAVGPGSSSLTIAPAGDFTSSTPRGAKVGHTASQGDPAAATYPAPLAISVVAGGIPGDVDGDGDVDLQDLLLVLGHFGAGAGGDADGDGDTDLQDLLLVLGSFGS